MWSLCQGEFSYELESSGTKNIQVVYAWMAAYVSKYEPTVFLLLSILLLYICAFL